MKNRKLSAEAGLFLNFWRLQPQIVLKLFLFPESPTKMEPLITQRTLALMARQPIILNDKLAAMQQLYSLIL